MVFVNNSILNINCLFISFLPIALVLGPAPADIALSLTSFFFLIFIFLNKEWREFKNKFTYLFCIFYLYLLFTSLISENIFLSLESSLFYFRFLFFVLCLKYLINNNFFVLNYLFYSIFLTFLFLILDSYFQYFFGYNILGYSYDGIRLSGVFKDEKILGSYLSRITPIFIGLSIFFYGNSKTKIILILSLVILIDILVILSGERTSIFYMFFSTFLIAILISKWKLYRIIAFIISLIISTSIILTNEKVKDRVVTKTISQVNLLGEKANTFSIQHQVIYSTALKIYVDNKIFGIGPKNFREICKQKKYKTFTEIDQSVDGCQSHPHNTYVQLLTETGIIGFLFILLIFVFFSYLLLKHAFDFVTKRRFNLNDVSICLIVSTYITLWPFAPTGSFFNNWLSIVYYLPLGILLSNIALGNKISKKNI